MSPPSLPRAATDALGRALTLDHPPQRIISLVPSLTEALFAYGLHDEIVGVTAYCVEPAAQVAAVPKIGGTKTPDVSAIIALHPDLVIASAEENVREHIEALIAAGLTVYVSLATGVRRALDELHDLARLVGRADHAGPWLAEAAHALAETEARTARRTPTPYFCPIWRRPYMVAGPDTYLSDLLRVCGGVSIYGAGAARYYPVELAEAVARQPAVVLLPSEPYPFADRHRQEVIAAGLPPARVHLVDGQSLTWYGPRMATALRTFSALFEAAPVEASR